MVGREQLQQPVLRMVRVLVLVHQHVPERLAPALARFGEALERIDGEEEHVVEVDRVREEEAALVEVVDVGDGLVVERRDALAILGRADEVVLLARDDGVDPARREALGVALELLDARLREAELVGLVVDREVRLVTEARRLGAQDATARGVEGEDPDRARDAAEQALEALAHLRRRLVRERDRKDLVRLHAAGREQMGDPVGEHARLARAGAGDHEQRPFGRHDRLALRGVQVGEIGLGRGDGHSRRC